MKTGEEFYSKGHQSLRLPRKTVLTPNLDHGRQDLCRLRPRVYLHLWRDVMSITRRRSAVWRTWWTTGSDPCSIKSEIRSQRKESERKWEQTHVVRWDGSRQGRHLNKNTTLNCKLRRQPGRAVNVFCVWLWKVHFARQRGVNNTPKNVSKDGHRMSKSWTWFPLHSGKARQQGWHDEMILTIRPWTKKVPRVCAVSCDVFESYNAEKVFVGVCVQPRLSLSFFDKLFEFFFFLLARFL